MKSITALLFYLTLCCCAAAQFKERTAQLTAQYNKAITDSQRVIVLGKLADHYYSFNLERSGDSVVNQQIIIAELTRSRSLLLKSLFESMTRGMTRNSSKERFENAQQRVEKALKYAKANDLEDYVSLAHAKYASLFRMRGQMDEALTQANRSLATAYDSKNDSIKVIAYLELGETYKQKGDLVLAFKTFNNAYDLTDPEKHPSLHADILQRYASLYQTLGDKESAKEYLLKSIDVHTGLNDSRGLVKDYFHLIQMTDNYESAKGYFSKVYVLCEKDDLVDQKLQAETMEFSYFIISGDPAKALAYLQQHPDLMQSYLNQGQHYLHYVTGEAYLYGKSPDSAVKYFRLAEPSFISDYDMNARQGFYEEMAMSYQQAGRQDEAINYYQKAMQIGQQTGNQAAIAGYALSLSKLYQQQNNFQQALFYYDQATTTRQKLDQKSAEKEMALLEIARENRRHEKQKAEEEAAVLKKRNLQYWGISIALVFFFLLLILIGMFPISKLTIKILSYFAFISLFEFIVLLIDSYLHHATHGEPLKIWMFKIFIIALLVPTQHFLEHALAHFLGSRKLVEFRKQISIKRWWSSIKKNANEEPEAVHDTAVS
jgi:tetratricopeptide (TPR) repeat protein